MSLKTMAQYKIWTNWNAIVLLSLLPRICLVLASNTAGCSNNEIEITLNNTTSSGNLSSPNYPDWIPANVTCIWILTCAPGRLIKLYLDEVMFNTTMKNHSYLEIHDGVKATSPLIVNITIKMNYTLPVIYSSGQKLSIHLKKWGLGEASGSIRFLISYSFIRPGKTCSASNSEDENNNILLTPPFLSTTGTDLPSEVDCTWKITPSARGVLMNITLNMKKTLLCSKGSVYIYDGPYGSASKLKHDLCKEPGEVPSFTSDVGLSLQLKSSNFSSILQIQASEDDCIRGSFTFYTKKQIEGQPLSRTQCQRKFSNPSGALLLNIIFLYLPPGCEDNSVQLFEINKHTNKSILRAKFCHLSPFTPVTAKIIIYSGQVLIVSKIQTPTSHLDGFSIHFFPYRIFAGIDRLYCSQENSPEQNANIIQTSRKGYVSSHLHTYESPYPPGMFCRWIIIPRNVTDNEQIKIRFLRFDFSKGYDKDCTQDHVQLDFGKGRVQRYCKGTGKPLVIYSGDAKSMTVTFVSTPLYTGNGGFSFNYDVVPVVTSPSPGKRLSWAVIGVLIGVGCLLVACIAFGIYRWKKKRQHDRVIQRITNEGDEQEDTLPEEQAIAAPTPQGPPPPYTCKDEDSQLLQQPTEERPYPWFSPGTTVMKHSPRERRPAPEIESEV